MSQRRGWRSIKSSSDFLDREKCWSNNFGLIKLSTRWFKLNRTLLTIKSCSQHIVVKEYIHFADILTNIQILGWKNEIVKIVCIKNIYRFTKGISNATPSLQVYFSAKITYLPVQNRGYVQSPDSIKAGRANFNFLKYNCPRYIGDPSISICDAEGFWLKRKPISGTWSCVTFYRGLLRYDFRENIGHLEVDIFLPYYVPLKWIAFVEFYRRLNFLSYLFLFFFYF